MKTKQIQNTIDAYCRAMFLPLVICVCSFAFQVGCSKDQANSAITPANARIAATIACTGTLTFAVKESDRPEVAAYIYAVAQAVRSLAGGTVPSPDQLNATIALFTKGAAVGQWTLLSTTIQGIYSGLYSSLNGDSKLAAQFLEAIAAGCEDAAAPYLIHSSPTP